MRTDGGDPRRAWLRHEAIDVEPPAGGFALLVVLPGGDGSIDVAPFVRDVLRGRAGDDVVVLQMIAPPIEPDDRDAVVWPTARLRDDRVDFTIEPVVHAAIDEAVRELPIDPKRIAVLGWSSGGPPAYGLTLVADGPVRGAVVAMSVFKPDLLPPLDGAKGRSFSIVHSPEDFIAMRFPDAARAALREAGARVELRPYAGGHGWNAEALDAVEAGLAFVLDAAAEGTTRR